MESLEYKIHSGYANDSKVFRSTLLVLDNIFNEISENYNGLYRNECRLKDVNSLIQKVKDKNERRVKDGLKEISSYNEVKKQIEDIIGCRLITLTTSKIVEINEIILTYQQFKIKKVKIIGDDDEYTKVTSPIRDKLKEVKAEKKLDFEVEPRYSDSGYFGLHYIIEFTPLQSFYKDYNIELFSVFELQVRTLLQHTWSEIEHKCVYKREGERKRADLTGGFNAVAISLSACDKSLDSFLSQNQSSFQKAPTYKLNLSQKIPEEYIDFVTFVEDYISKIEENEGQFEKERIRSEVINKFNNNVEKLNKEQGKKELLFPALSLAELYLKGKFYDEAMTLYEKYVPLETDDVWVNLRVAEVYQAQANNALRKDQEKHFQSKAFKYLDELAKKITEENSEEQAKPSQCNGAALILWSLHMKVNSSHETCIDVAFYFSDLCLKNASKSTDEVSSVDLVKYKLNYCYIYLEHIENSSNDGLIYLKEDEYKVILTELKSACSLFKEVKSSSKERMISNEPSIHDSIAWIYHQLASVKHERLNALGNPIPDEELEDVKKMRWESLEHSNRCLSIYSDNKSLFDIKKKQSIGLWKQHNHEIMRVITMLLKPKEEALRQ